MTVIHSARSSRRSRSTILEMGLYCFRSHLTVSHRVKLSRKLISKPKRHIDFISSWINKWSLLYLMMLSICILLHYRSPPINDLNDHIKSSFYVNNKTLINHKYLNWIHYDWCSSSSHSLNTTSSYAVLDRSVLVLIATCFIMLIIGLVLYFNLNDKSTNNYSLHFWHGLLTLGMFVGSSTCNQWISLLTCRPVEILYDQGFTSIISVQMFGFLTCLHFTYGLGSIFTPLFDQCKTSKVSNKFIASRSNTHVPSLPSIKSIP